MKIFIRIILVWVGLTFSSPGFTQDASPVLPTITHSLTTTVIKPGPMPYSYFLVRPDYRKCASPFCGGVFVQAVNHKLTRCPDGKWRAECYVAWVGNPKNFLLDKGSLVYGYVKAKPFFDLGKFGTLYVRAAYRPVTAKMPQGKFVGLASNGIMCITSPCFSFDEHILNSNWKRVISGIDLVAAGASEKMVQRAYDLMANGKWVLAAGFNKQVAELAGPGITFVASQFYLPAPTVK